MNDVLVARGGFGDDTALMRMSHAAHLSVRTVEGTLETVTPESVGTATACIVFAANCRRVDGDADLGGCATAAPDGVRDSAAAVRTSSRRHPGVAFVAVLDDAALVGDVERAAATVALLDAGADDVISCAITPAELEARVSAAVRRVNRAQGAPRLVANAVEGSPPHVDAARRELVGASGRAVMTAKEAIVMGVLVGRHDVVSRAEFEAALWTGQWRGTPKAVDMHIAKLRPKLRVATGGQWQIETVRGAGFVLTRREGEALVSVGMGLAHPATPA